MDDLVKILTKNNERLITQVEAQGEQIKLLNEQVAYLSRKLFGTSSEKTPSDHQLSLFDEEQEVFKRRRQPKTKPSQNSLSDVKRKKD